MSKFYVSTAIAYTNAPPHLGHAAEFVFADVIARYHRLKDDDTYFLTGTDEHGSKIYKTAVEQGENVQSFVDKYAQSFKDMMQKYNLTHDQFIRTTDETHKRRVQIIWNKLQENGDLYLNKYSGLYCSGCEAFLTDKDLIDGRCPNHLKEPEVIEEENYFFKLSKYNNQIKKLIESDELRISPDSRKNEMLSLLNEGLVDVSFSRSKEAMPWGIDVPNDPDQVMYVWCDALSNYITAIGYGEDWDLFNKYWPCDLHIIGKDVLRFHACIWIGMLLSLEIDTPKEIGVHGFITSNGQKMSKSIGNVIDPMELLDKYPIDAIRFFLCREIPTGDDGDFNYERFNIVYSTDLANNFGNLTSRTIGMLNKYFDGVVPDVKEFSFETEFEEMFKNYSMYIEQFDLKKGVEEVIEFMNKLNLYVENSKPWDLFKLENFDKLQQVLFDLMEGVKRVNMLLAPYIPETSYKVMDILNIQNQSTFDNVLSFDLRNTKVNPIQPLFPRLES